METLNDEIMKERRKGGRYAYNATDGFLANAEELYGKICVDGY